MEAEAAAREPDRADAASARFAPSPVLRTARLELLPFSLDLVEAMIEADEPRLLAVTGARFPGGIIPPLMDDHLSEWRTLLRANPDTPPWRAWIAIDRALGEAVGTAGGGGMADTHGCVLVGWAVYPRYERRGYGTDAARAVIDWMRAQPNIRCVRATVPPDNLPSIRVAEKLGMRHVGEDTDPEVGAVLVFEISGASP
jgi:RimJ/RimL family protein N-acetyltransferase